MQGSSFSGFAATFGGPDERTVQTCLPKDETVEGDPHGPHVQCLQETAHSDMDCNITENRMKNIPIAINRSYCTDKKST